MAATWIKMRTDLRNHPKVVRMASALKADRLRVIGGLWSVWGTFDTHSCDGLLEGYTLAAVDDDLNWRGFASAMQAVGWLEESESGLGMPRFDEHNGKSAKRRAQDADRKKSDREEDDSAHGSWNVGGQMSASDADKLGTREELEKKKTSSSTQRGSRLPENWNPGESGFAFAQAHGVANGRAQAELDKFRDWWAAQPGQKGVKLDWQATWRTWIRTALERKPGQTADDIFAGAR